MKAPRSFGRIAAVVTMLAAGGFTGAVADDVVVEPTGSGTATAGAAVNAQPSERLYSSTELRADLEQMYRGLQSAHFDLYAYTKRSELGRRYAATRASFDVPLTLAAAGTRLQEFAAAVKMGHTRVDADRPQWQRFRGAGGKGFPLSIRIVDDRVYVAQNLSGVAGISPGDEIIAMQGQPMSRWLARTAQHVSAESPYMAHSLLEYDFAICVWLEIGAVETFDVSLKSGTDKARSVRVPARSRADMQAASAKQPALLDLGTPMRDARLLTDGVAYLRPGPFYNADAQTEAEQWDVSGFRSFIDKSFATFDKAKAKSLIVDLRGNPGGDNLFSDVMVSWFATKPFRFASSFRVKVSEQSIAANTSRIEKDAAAAGPVSQQYARLYEKAKIGDVVDFDIALANPKPEPRFTGKVYVLIDRHSYSNAVAVAALIQDYGFGTILGEPTADLATTYGAMERFTLTHTGLVVGYPKARIVRPSGDLRARGVTPDIAIKTPIIETPEDAVLKAAVEIAKPQ